MLRASFERIRHEFLRAASQNNDTAVAAKHFEDDRVAKCQLLVNLRPPLAICRHVLLNIHRAGDGVLLGQAQSLTKQLSFSNFRLLRASTR